MSSTLQDFELSFLHVPAKALRRTTSAAEQTKKRSPFSFAGLAAILLLIGPACAEAQVAGHVVGDESTLILGSDLPTTTFPLISTAIADGMGNVFLLDDYKLYELPKTGAGYGVPFQPIPNLEPVTHVEVDTAGNLYVKGSLAILKYPKVENGYGAPTTVFFIRSVSNYSTVVDRFIVDAKQNVFVAARAVNSTSDSIWKIPFHDGVYGGRQTIVYRSSAIGTVSGFAMDMEGNIFLASLIYGYPSPLAKSTVVKLAVTSTGYSQPMLLGDGLFIDPQTVAVDQAGDVFVLDKEAPGGSDAIIWKLRPTVNGDYATPFVFEEITPEYTARETQPVSINIDATGALYYLVQTQGYSYIYDSRIVKIDPSPDFGAVAVTTGAPVRKSLVVRFDKTGNLGSATVGTQGAAGLDYADAGTGTCTTQGASYLYQKGDSCTVDMKFLPQEPGARYGGLELHNGGGTVFAATNLRGKGIAPQLTFGTGVQPLLPTGLDNPAGVAVSAVGDFFVVDYKSGVLKKFAVSGNGGLRLPLTIASGLSTPGGIALDNYGNVFVVETASGLVRKIPFSQGKYRNPAIAVSGLAMPKGIAVDGLGNLYVTNSGNRAVEKFFYTDGAYTARQTLPGNFLDPVGIALDVDGNVFVTDAGNGSLQEIPFLYGIYQAPATIYNGFVMPGLLAIDGGANLYVAETGRSEIRKFPKTASGYASAMTLGSGLLYPLGVAADPSGNLYITDQSSNVANRTRRLSLAVAPTLNFAPATVGSVNADSLKTFVLTNSGNATLVLPILHSGDNPSLSSTNFRDVSEVCPQLSDGASAPNLVPAGTSCLIPVYFIPDTPGVKAAQLVFTDNNLNVDGSQHVVTLNGVAVAPSE